MDKSTGLRWGSDGVDLIKGAEIKEGGENLKGEGNYNRKEKYDNILVNDNMDKQGLDIVDISRLTYGSMDYLSLSTIVTNKTYIECGEEYLTKVTLRNRSDRDIFNIVIKNAIPSGAKAGNGAVKIGGKEDYGNHLALGINITKIESGSDIEISYPLKGILENGGEIQNKINIIYEYYDYNLEKYIQQSKDIECNKIYINNPNLLNKALWFNTSITNPDRKERFILNLNIKNTGNISSNNTVISIELPREIRRDTEDIKINGKSADIPKGVREIKIGKIDVKSLISIEIPLVGIERTEVLPAKIEGKITYDSFIRPDEPRKKLINLKPIEVLITSPRLKIITETSDSHPILNDTIEIKYTIINKGNEESIDGKLFLNIPKELSLQENIFLLDGEVKSGDEVLTGIKFGGLEVGEKREVKLKLLCMKTTGDETTSLEGRIGYKFKSRDNDELKYSEKILKNHSLSISNAECLLEVECDKENVILDDLVSYTLKVRNEGTIEALNVTLVGEASSGIKILKESTQINKETFQIGNIEKGICIGNMAPKEVKEISFIGKVTSINSLRNIKATFKGSFQYRNKNCTIKEKKIREVEIINYSQEAMFKSLSLESIIETGNKSHNIEEILEVKSKIILKDYYPVNSTNIKGLEGEEKIINKLIINGVIETTLEYISDEILESIYLVTNKTIFSTFIVLPEDYKRENKLEIGSEVTDNYTRIVSPKSIYLISNITLEGRVIR